MSFFPDLDRWVHIHYVEMPERTIAEIGDFTGKEILDLGCGEMLASFGLAARGASHVSGLDLSAVDLDEVVKRLVAAGFPQAADDRDKVSSYGYDGVHMPFEDDRFDIVFCWGVMEHVANVPAVLAEMKRVMKPGGLAFISVFPWFHSFYGSHLSDFVPPFAHLTHDAPSLRKIVEREAPRQSAVPPDLVLGPVWGAYETLNRYSANMFYRDVKAAGFSRDVWKLVSHQHDLTMAPAAYDLSDLMISGTDTLLFK